MPRIEHPAEHPAGSTPSPALPAAGVQRHPHSAAGAGRAFTAASLLALGLLAGCGKATEMAAEKVIEAQAAREGVQAKVDLSEGQTRVKATDDQGRTSELALGGVALTEADLGVPVYPGARFDEAGGSRMESPDGKMVMAQLRTADAPEKVATFYRDLLRGQSAGKQFMETSMGEGATLLMLNDEAAKVGLQVQISPGDEGTEINVQHLRGN